MKNIFLAVSIFTVCLIKAQVINIPDPNFKNKLLQADLTNGIALDINFQSLIIDGNGNGNIEVNEVINIAYLNIFSSSISNLTGIEKFTNLQRLAVNNNSLFSIDISALTQLKLLRCDYNYLSTLDLTGLSAIEGVNISSNNFSAFNLNNLPNLKDFECANNQIYSLDCSNNSMLTTLVCKNNNLNYLNIKNGINQDFSIAGLNDCWKQGNPNLTNICADAGEVASVQSFLDGCGDAGQVVMVTSTCSMANEGFTKDSFTISPNPTNGNININYNGNYNDNYNDNGNSNGNSNGTIKMVQLYDSQGRVLLTKTSAENPTTLDVSGYASGVYFVKIVGEASEKIVKVVKE